MAKVTRNQEKEKEINKMKNNTFFFHRCCSTFDIPLLFFSHRFEKSTGKLKRATHLWQKMTSRKWRNSKNKRQYHTQKTPMQQLAMPLKRFQWSPMHTPNPLQSSSSHSSSDPSRISMTPFSESRKNFTITKLKTTKQCKSLKMIFLFFCKNDVFCASSLQQCQWPRCYAY